LARMRGLQFLKIERDIILRKVVAAPSHRMINARVVDWGHDTFS
jgi:hypothetical protein